MVRFVAIAALLVACAKPEAEEPAPSLRPSVRIDSPDAASFVAVGPLTLKGTAFDVLTVAVTPGPGVLTPDDDVLIDAPLTGTSFQAEVTAGWGINAYEAKATDANGNTWLARRSVLAGTFAPADAPVEQAAQARMEEPAIDTLARMIEAALDPVVVSKALAGAGPVFEETYGIFGIDAVELSASVDALDFGRADLGIDAVPGALVVELVLPAIEIGVPVSGSIVGIGFSERAIVGCDQAVISGRVRVGTDGNGGLDLEVLDPAIELRGFWYDVSLLPGQALEGLFTDSLQGILQDTLVEQVATGLPVLIDAQLAGLTAPIEVPFLETSAAITPRFRTALVDEQGLGLVLDLDVEVPIRGTKSAPGYLYGATSLPPLSGNDLAMAVSDDLVNRVLHELWAGGVLDLRINADDELLDPALFEELGGHEGGAIEIDARLPPVLVQSDDGLPRLQAGEMLLRLETPNGDNGEFIELAVAMSAVIDLEVKGGALLGTVTDPQLTYIVRDTDWIGGHETITRLVEASLPVDDLVPLLGTLEFPLPSIGGFSFDDARIERSSGSASTTIVMDF